MALRTMNKSDKGFSSLYRVSMAGALALSMMSVASADDDDWNGFSLVANFGISRIGDQSIFLTGGTSDDGNHHLDNGSDGIGYVGGIGLRYNFGPAWETEVAWEHRKNNGTMRSDDGRSTSDFDYESSLVSLNQRRYFNTGGDWQPYVGAGLMAIEDLKLDYASNGNHRSYHGDGGIGVQLMTGLRYRSPESRVFLGFELRYGSVEGQTLSGDGGGMIDDIDYGPLTLQMNIGWK